MSSSKLMFQGLIVKMSRCHYQQQAGFASRVLTAYNRFFKEHFKSFDLAVPKLTFAQKSGRLAEMWKVLPENQRSVYITQANEDKQKANEATTEVGKAKRTKKAAETPEDKRPKNAYSLFVKESFCDIRKSNPSFNFGQVAKVISQRWHLMSDETKEAWKAKAAGKP